MQYILSVICISAVALLMSSVKAADEENEDSKNMMRQIAADCIQTWNATKEDVDNMCNKVLPTTRTGKCLSFCMMKQFNCINDEGVFQRDDFMDCIKMTTDNETMIAMSDRVSKKCEKTKDPKDDNCETTALILKCLKEGAEAEGFKN